jgi:hypothetical protein
MAIWLRKARVAKVALTLALSLMPTQFKVASTMRAMMATIPSVKFVPRAGTTKAR